MNDNVVVTGATTPITVATRDDGSGAQMQVVEDIMILGALEDHEKILRDIRDLLSAILEKLD